jgi:hypothetical protein
VEARLWWALVGEVGPSPRCPVVRAEETLRPPKITGPDRFSRLRPLNPTVTFSLDSRAIS